MSYFRYKILFAAVIFLNGMYASTVLSVSVVPQTQTTYIQKTWGAFLTELSKKTRLEFELQHYVSIPLFENALKEGKPDIAFMNPYHAVMAYQWQKYIPIIHDKQELVGILVVKKESSIQSVNQLNNKKNCFSCTQCVCGFFVYACIVNTKRACQFSTCLC